MPHLATFVSALFLTQISSLLAMTHGSRTPHIPRIISDPCRNQEVGKFIKDRYNCEKFFYCAPDELAISVNCPHGMIFNDEKEICDFPSNYFCIPEARDEDQVDTTVRQQQTTIVPPTHPVRVDPDRCPIDDASGLVFLPDRNECHRYYICYHGFPISQECIPELHWNQRMGRCDFPENAGCLVTTTTTPATTSVSFVGVGMNCPFRGEQIFPHPEQCNYFIYCINGYATVQQCPFFHYYDVQSKTCMWQTMARCIMSKEIPKSKV